MEEFIHLVYQWYTKALHDKAVVCDEHILNDKMRQDALLHFMIRTVFIWFLRECGWIKPDIIKKESAVPLDNDPAIHRSDVFYRSVLRKLLAQVLAAQNTLSESQLNWISNVVIIDAGIVSDIHILSMPDDLFWSDTPNQPGLFDILEQYAFTLDEHGECDENTLSPERLGTVFEQLLAVYSQTEDNRRKTGSYYTPSAVVDAMVISSFVSLLSERHPDIPNNLIRQLCREPVCPRELDHQACTAILKTLDSLTIWDPACGCGAFPLGTLKFLTALHRRLGSILPGFALKRRIIANNLYGADIQPLAIEITKLRFILSLISSLEPDYAKPNAGLPDLPHLTFHFVCADTTMILPKADSPEQSDIFGSHIRSLRNRLQSMRRAQAAALSADPDDAKLDLECRKELMASGSGASFTDRQAAKWDPYRMDDVADYFDPMWMYGIAPDDEGRAFDLVIGNPPYGTEISADKKSLYKQNYKLLEKRYDIYMVFFERGFQLCKDTLCYITPDKWLSKSFAARFREQMMMPCLSEMIHLGQNAFYSVIVDAVISVFNRHHKDIVDLYKYRKCGNHALVCHVNKDEIHKPYLLDPYFSEDGDGFKKLDKLPNRLGNFCKCEYAMANPKDAYTLRDLLDEASDVVSGDYLKVINTGTIGKYVSRWGTKPMKYLKHKFERPIVSKQMIKESFGQTFLDRMCSPKIIIKGLNLMDACVDIAGNTMSTVATLMIRTHSLSLLNVVSMILNSQLITDYLKSKYITSSYCGGLEFTLDMINDIPVPDLDEICMDSNLIIEIDCLMYSIPKQQKRCRLESIVRSIYHIDD